MGELAFDNVEDLQKWLETRSPEEAMALASRSALRAVPYLNGFLIGQMDRRREIILPLFRGIAVATSARRRISEIANAALSAVLFADPVVRSSGFGLSAEFAARSALSATLSAARSDTLSAAEAAAHSADATARFIAWKAISQDVDAIENGTINTRTLWYDTIPRDVAEHWSSLRIALLSIEDEDWGVWTEWYEAHLFGDPPDISLEHARALIPNVIWKKGPKVTNAEIRRLMNEHAMRKRGEAEEQVSPSPVITGGKLDAVPNPAIDIPDDDPDLPKLLRRQRANIGDILDAVATMRGNEFRTVPRALARYETEIIDNGARVSIDYLNDRRAIARSEYLSLYREKFFDTEAGLRRAFLNFFALHKAILTHYPLDADRRALLESFATPTDRPDPASLDEAIEEVKEGIAAAIDADAMTARYASYMGGMMDDIAHITYTPPLAGMAVETIDPQMADPPSPRMGLAKQLYLKVAAFSGATVRVLTKLPSSAIVGNAVGIAGLLQTPWGKSLLDALTRLRDLLWALF